MTTRCTFVRCDTDNTTYCFDRSSVTTVNHFSLKEITVLEIQHRNKYSKDIDCCLEKKT